MPRLRHRLTARKPVVPTVQVACGQTERFLKSGEQQGRICPLLFDLNGTNYFHLRDKNWKVIYLMLK
jgi:hypothetical protein